MDTKEAMDGHYDALCEIGVVIEQLYAFDSDGRFEHA